MLAAALVPPTPVKLEALDAPAHVRQVALNVRDVAATALFYRRVLGLVLEREDADEAVLANEAGEPLLILRRCAAAAAAPGGPGLFHTAFLLHSRRDLANWAAHAQALGVRFEGASDHLVSEAIYLSDPEGNGIEVYVDRPRGQWAREGEGVRMATLPLDGASLMAEQDGEPGDWAFNGRIGHVHLKVGDLAVAEAFYREELGLAVMARYPGAVFLGWGGYHHHIAINAWSSKGAAPRAPDAPGLASVLLAYAGDPPWPEAGKALVDPSGNRILLG